MSTLSKAANDILAERQRQLKSPKKAFMPDYATAGELAGAGAALAAYRSHAPVEFVMGNDLIENLWPLPADAWTLGTPREDLVRAAAYLLAAVETIDQQR